jgi:hypothetical protein
VRNVFFFKFFLSILLFFKKSYVCYQSDCVDASAIITSQVPVKPCSPNPCRNGAQCVSSFTTKIFVCNCPADYTG